MPFGGYGKWPRARVRPVQHRRLHRAQIRPDASRAADIMVDGAARRGQSVSRIVPVLTAAEAVGGCPAARQYRSVRRAAWAARTPCSRPSGPGSPPMGEGGDLTLLHPIAASDMYGIDGIDHLTSPGADQACHRWLLSEWAVVSHATEDRHADRGRARSRPTTSRRASCFSSIEPRRSGNPVS